MADGRLPHDSKTTLFTHNRTSMCDHLSRATTPSKRLLIQNTKVKVKALKLEPLVNDHLL